MHPLSGSALRCQYNQVELVNVVTSGKYISVRSGGKKNKI
jgi:hypothetical protein